MATSTILADTAFAGVSSQSSARKVQSTTATSLRGDTPFKQNLLSRLFAALIAWRQRQADEIIGRYIAANGGKLTDNIEREIQHRLT